MKYTHKILKYINYFRENNPSNAFLNLNDIINEFDISKKVAYAEIKHLVNLGLILSSSGIQGMTVDVSIGRLIITTGGVKFLENYWSKKIKSWIPVLFSFLALTISFIALFK